MNLSRVSTILVRFAHCLKSVKEVRVRQPSFANVQTFRQWQACGMGKHTQKENGGFGPCGVAVVVDGYSLFLAGQHIVPP